MFESSYPLVFLAWFLGGFINGVSGMGAAMVALPIVACVLEMSEAVPATCLVAVTLAVYVAWMYRAHSRVAPIIPMLLGCIPGLIIGVCVLRVVPGIWLQGGLGAALIVYVAWQLLHRAGYGAPRERAGLRRIGVRIGVRQRGDQLQRAASGDLCALRWLGQGHHSRDAQPVFSWHQYLYLHCSSRRRAIYSRRGQGRTLGYARRIGRAWSSPWPIARFVRESVFQGILLVMIAFAGSVCIIRAVESFL